MTSGLPPFRADHVGSLLRPQSLMTAYSDYRSGHLSAESLAAAQDNAIREAIAMQESIGLESITDGEFRRVSYWARFVTRVEGLEVAKATFTFRDDCGHQEQFSAPHVSNPVRRRTDIAVDEFRFVRASTRHTPKITLPSPPSMHFWRLGEGVDKSAYLDTSAYFIDLASVYREEINALATAGSTYIQLDDVPFAMLCDPDIRAQVAARGVDANQLLLDYVDLCNDSLRDRPAGVTIAMHLCRGNYKAHFLSEGGYEAIAELLFNKLAVDAFFLEFDSPRAGDFMPLRFMPADRRVVLGLVSSKSPVLETQDYLQRRLDEAARVVEPASLCISPQCGFASTIGGNPLTVDDQRAKLTLVVETARNTW
ncbi:MAG: 5-methyltetrahydropteroyltriglutamate--homocysteine S-methyltransferase [Pseudomonadota bacterium]|nr:5-methyltetrahydropteroyltriglutamate--homocysteine S-methyltransferase [Pseudomonadota bacterium]